MRSLAIGYGIGSFLQPDNLPVGKFTTIVNKRHGTDCTTNISWTASWFIDFTSIDFDLLGMVASETAEEGDFHVRDNRGRSNDKTLDTDEFVGI